MSKKDFAKTLRIVRKIHRTTGALLFIFFLLLQLQAYCLDGKRIEKTLFQKHYHQNYLTGYQDLYQESNLMILIAVLSHIKLMLLNH